MKTEFVSVAKVFVPHGAKCENVASALRNLTRIAGGVTCSESQGAWIDDAAAVIAEPVTTAEFVVMDDDAPEFLAALEEALTALIASGESLALATVTDGGRVTRYTVSSNDIN